MVLIYEDSSMEDLIIEYCRIEKLPPSRCGNCMIERVEKQQEIANELKERFNFDI